jgi:hypothetical protein
MKLLDDNAPGGSNNVGYVNGIILNKTASTSIKKYSAIIGGNITSDGGSQIINREVCWITNPNPTIANSHINDGNSLGIYSSYISLLNPGKLYYLRAFALNTTTTNYGNQITLTTLSTTNGGCAGWPSIVTNINENIYDVVVSKF